MVHLSLLAALLEDVKRGRPDLPLDFADDLQKVISLVGTRGLPIVMIDFPDACKVLDASLACSYLDIDKLPSIFVSKGRIQIFEQLFLDLFDEGWHLRLNPDVNTIFYLRQLLLFWKKVDKPCPQKNVDKAISEFVEIEDSMRPPTLNWFSNEELEVRRLSVLGPELPLFRDQVPRKLLKYFDLYSRYISQWFPFLNPEDIKPRHGPGSVSDLRSGTDKYRFPFWPVKLSNRFGPEFGLPNLGFDVPDGCFLDSEPLARLIAVPKTLKSPRLIASEPTAHQFLQQGLMIWFRKNLPKPLCQSINLDDQTPSRLGAQRASISGDFATVDLSSASDRLSLWLVERFFNTREDILQCLHSVRTRYLDVNGNLLRLKKHANQGSAITFTLQSIIYLCICCAATAFEKGYPLSIKGLRRSIKECRVFGDDLIVPTEAVRALGDLMAYLGLKVNWGKTHYKGQFRESCGIDCFAGYDVSPLYLSDLAPKSDPKGLYSWIDIANLAYMKGLWSLSDKMIQVLPGSIRESLPVSPGPLGCLSLCTRQKWGFGAHIKGRWNSTLQRCEILGLQPKLQATKGERDGSSQLLHFFLNCNPVQHWDDIFVTKKSSILADYRLRLKRRWVPSETRRPV